MSEEQETPGVPDGYRIVRVRKMNAEYNDPYYEALLERIPKPKRRVLIAEAEVPEDFRIEDPGETQIHISRFSGANIKVTRCPAIWRIEERDA